MRHRGECYDDGQMSKLHTDEKLGDSYWNGQTIKMCLTLRRFRSFNVRIREMDGACGREKVIARRRKMDESRRGVVEDRQAVLVKSM